MIFIFLERDIWTFIQQGHIKQSDSYDNLMVKLNSLESLITFPCHQCAGFRVIKKSIELFTVFKCEFLRNLRE